MRFIVDLDQERGIPAREGRTPNTHRVAIRKTNAVNLAAISGYLEGKMQFGNAVLEAISKNFFLNNHLFLTVTRLPGPSPP